MEEINEKKINVRNIILVILFIVIGISILTGVILPNPSPITYDDGITGSGDSISGLYYSNTYNGMTLSFLFKEGNGLFNETECNFNSKQWGENCSCRLCIAWSGYDTEGFTNESGIYYSNGTSTGIPQQTLDNFVELNRTKYQFELIMQGHNGYTYNGAEWSKDGHPLSYTQNPTRSENTNGLSYNNTLDDKSKTELQ